MTMKSSNPYLTKKGKKILLDTSLDETKLRFYSILRDHEDRIRELEKKAKRDYKKK